MAKTNDTIDGLLAEFRGYSAGMPASYHVTMSWADFRKMLDRFDAARKRERGDRAKLREALEKVIEITNKEWDAHRETSAMWEMWEICTAALAAPPRNCDLARDWMRDLYAHFKPPASIKREMPPEWVDSVMAFCRWLVAPATEKEGGAK